MTNIILIQDLFEGMTAGTDINGRVPPITDSGVAWQREVGGTATSDGAGGIIFSAVNIHIKVTSLAESNLAIRTVWNRGTAANGHGIYIGDWSVSTIYPRDAYGAHFLPLEGQVIFVRMDEFVATVIGSIITGVTYNAGDNTQVFQRAGNTFQAWVNGVSVGSFTDATYQPNGQCRRHGVLPNPWVNNTCRLKSVEVLDSFQSVQAQFPVSEVW